MPKASFIMISARDSYPYAGRPSQHLFDPTLYCMEQQSFKDFEWVIVDNQYETRKDYFKDKNLPFSVKHVPAKPNVWLENGFTGVSTQYNQGIIYADGEILFFTGDSYIFPPNFMDTLWRNYLNGNFSLAWYMFDNTLCETPTRGELNLPKSPVPYDILGYTGENAGVEHRYQKTFHGNSTAQRHVQWDWWFGCSSASAEAMLEIGGFNQCVPPETIILGEHIKKISDVYKEDKILGHDGKFHKVSNVFTRHYSGELIELVPSMFNLPFKLTPDHPVLTVKPKKYGRIIAKPTNRHGVISHYKNLEWKKAKDIEIGDYVVFPQFSEEQDLASIKISDFIDVIVKEEKVYAKTYNYGKICRASCSKPVNNHIPITTDFLRLCGYYLSEGSVNHNPKCRQIQFTFHKKEVIYANDVKELIRMIFGIDVKIFINKKSQMVIAYSSTLSRFFDALLKSGAHNKSIPFMFLVLPKSKIEHLLKGMFRGDGSIQKKGNRLRITYATVSTSLAYQLAIILSKLDVIPYIGYEKKKSSFTTNKIYEFVISGTSASRLKHILDIEYSVKKKLGNVGFVYNKYLYLPIRLINKIQYDGIVHNLEITETNSYVSTFTVHNCMDGDKQLMDVDVGSRLEMAGYGGQLVMDRGFWLARLGLKPRSYFLGRNAEDVTIKCNYGLLGWSRLRNEPKANVKALSDADIEWIKAVVCAQHCGLREFCKANHPWQYPFEHKEGYAGHGSTKAWFEFWKQHQGLIDLKEERELRIDGDPKYAEGTFTEPKD